MRIYYKSLIVHFTNFHPPPHTLLDVQIYADKCQLYKVQYEQRLLEQVILGTAYEKVREKILEEVLTLSEALEVAREIEMERN